MRLSRFCVLMIAMLAFGERRAAGTELEFLPPSRHQQLLTYGLFTEEHSAILLRDAGRAWGAIGGHVALLEAPSWSGQPQFIFHGSANSSFRLNDQYLGLLTETIDARVGFSVDFKLAEELRFSVGWTHFSGHISDDVPDRDLIGPNLGVEFFPARIVYDGWSGFRIGGTLKPILGSDPTLKPFAADQFAEWYPWGSREKTRGGTPFVALGFEQWGRHRIEWSSHVQTGVYFGSHLSETHASAARLVVGAYRGWDPSLKYAVFKNSTPTFEYLGAMFDF